MTDTYLTDGRRLFRVAAPLDPDTGRRVELEDCMTLETRSFGSAELWKMRLRPVKAPDREAAPA